MEEESILTFPCDIPVKVFGLNDDTFRAAVITMVRDHFPDFVEADVSEKLSREQKYLSLTITVRAQSRAQVDGLYIDLTASADVLMVL